MGNGHKVKLPYVHACASHTVQSVDVYGNIGRYGQHKAHICT